MRMNKSRLLGVTALVTLSALFASPVTALETFKHVDTKSFDIGSTPNINIEAISGDVSFLGTEGGSATVEIVIEIRAKNAAEADEIRSHLNLIVEGESGYLDVRMTESRDFYNWLRDEYSRHHHVSVGFHVTGPRGADGTVSSVSGNAAVESAKGPIEVTSVSGDVLAIGIEQSVRASTTSGNVDVRRASGIVIAQSVSGDVTASECGGDLDIESTSGNVHAREVGGTVTAETVSGDIETLGIAGAVSAESVSGSVWIENREGSVQASTISGDIDVQTQTVGDVGLESLSGSVNLALEPQPFGEVYLSAPSGGIDSDLPIKIRRQSEGRLQGTLGSGTARLRVTTDSGDIVMSGL